MFSPDCPSSSSEAIPIFILSLIVLFLTRLAFKAISRSACSAPPLPPGPWPLPLVGNIPFLKPNLHVQFAELSATYGPIFRLHLGSKLAVVVTSPSAARAILKDNDANFANRDAPITAKAASYGGTDILWRNYGPEWRELRKVCTIKMLSNATLDSAYELRRMEVRKFVRYVYEKVGSEVRVGDLIISTVTNVTTNMVIGKTMTGDEREIAGRKIGDILVKLVDLIATPDLSDFFAVLTRFDVQGLVKKVKVLVRRYDELLDKIIEEAASSARDRIDGGMDFVQYLLKLREEDDVKANLSNTQIKALVIDMMTGGIETSSKTIDFAMIETVNNPRVLTKVQRELDEVVGRDNVVEESHINKLPYLHAIMCETLRLHPVVPLLVPHSPIETTTVEGYTIPKGARVFVNAWAIHRDPSSWDNPDEFRPERFVDRNFDLKGNDFRYIPFGSGRRKCAGIAMAERMVMYTLSTLLHSFEWRLPRGEKINIVEEFGLVLKNKTPLILIPSPRLSNPGLYD